MRNYNYNIMQLMSNAFTFKKEIENLNSHYYKDEKISHKMLDDLYISPPVKRMLWQSIQIVDDIKKDKRQIRKRFLSRWLEEKKMQVEGSFQENQN